MCVCVAVCPEACVFTEHEHFNGILEIIMCATKLGCIKMGGLVLQQDLTLHHDIKC